jgi:hypothetical protein
MVFPRIRVQALFLIAIVLKVLSSGLGWWFGFPWSLGFWVPLLVMGVYVALGLVRREDDVTDEKFADTCYYLGFIFTITSIIFSLFDLPNIGTQISSIAVRFGAAMVSTVIGLVVRVMLVSFREDATSAIVSAEAGLIDAAHRFREQLMMSYERLREFDTAVDSASKGAVERVSLQIERLSRNHAEKLSSFFGELVLHNRTTFDESLAQVNDATRRLAQSMDSYREGMEKNLKQLEDRVETFGLGISEKLANTSFPDDFFSSRLEAPMGQLRSSTQALADSAQMTAEEVLEGAQMLGTSLKAIRLKSKTAENALDTVASLSVQQSALHSSAEQQIETLKALTASILEIERTLASTTNQLLVAQDVSSQLVGKVDAVVTDSTQTRRMLESSLGAVTSSLSSNASATESIAKRLGAHTAATEKVSARLEAVAAADAATATALTNAGSNTVETLARASDALAQLREMTSILGTMSATLQKVQGVSTGSLPVVTIGTSAGSTTTRPPSDNSTIGIQPKAYLVEPAIPRFPATTSPSEKLPYEVKPSK